MIGAFHFYYTNKIKKDEIKKRILPTVQNNKSVYFLWKGMHTHVVLKSDHMNYFQPCC